MRFSFAGYKTGNSVLEKLGTAYGVYIQNSEDGENSHHEPAENTPAGWMKAGCFTKETERIQMKRYRFRKE